LVLGKTLNCPDDRSMGSFPFYVSSNTAIKPCSYLLTKNLYEKNEIPLKLYTQAGIRKIYLEFLGFDVFWAFGLVNFTS